MTLHISKRIIQTGRTREFSILEKATIANLKLMNPGFEYIYFDDQEVNEFIRREFPEYSRIFDSFQIPIQKYDFFRYLAVYRLGGFYFDLDVLLCDDLSDLLEYGSVFTFERITFNKYLRREHAMDWEVGNYAFGAAPGHPFMRALIDNCIKSQMDPGWAGVMVDSMPWYFREDARVLCTTGPGMVSRTYAENAEIRESVKVLLPVDIYDRGNWYLFGKYGAHLMKSTWRKRKNKIYNVLRNFCEARTEKKYVKLGQLGKRKRLEFEEKSKSPE